MYTRLGTMSTFAFRNIICVALLYSEVFGFIFNFATSDPNSARCPHMLHDIHLRVYKNKCLEFVTSSQTGWDEARNYCRFQGADLAVVTDRDMNSYILRTLKELRFNSDGIWIGLKYSSPSRSWRWINGQSLLGYTNWQTNEGNGLSSPCAFLRFRVYGKWYNSGCTPKYSYICEHDLDPQTAHVFTKTNTHETTVSTPTTTPSTTSATTLMTTKSTTPTTITTRKTTTSSTTTTSTPTTTPTTTRTTTSTTTQTTTSTTPANTPTSKQATSATPQTTTTQTKSTTTPTAIPSTATTPTTTIPTTRPSTKKTTVSTTTVFQCPAFDCSLDCGIFGYKVSSLGCPLCECSV